MTSNIAKIHTESKALTPMDMLQIAVEKGTDLDQLTKLMDLQERWEKNAAKKAFVQAMGAFKANPPDVHKTKKANYGFHAENAVVSKIIGEALSKHALTHRWAVDQSDPAAIKVTCIITHEEGHSEDTTMSAPADNSGSKNPVQAVGSTVTYLERYTLQAATGVIAGDDDTDGAMPAQFITAEQKETLVNLIKTTGADTTQFLRHLRVENLDQLERTRYDAAVSALNNRGKK